MAQVVRLSGASPKHVEAFPGQFKEQRATAMADAHILAEYATIQGDPNRLAGVNEYIKLRDQKKSKGAVSIVSPKHQVVSHQEISGPTRLA